MLGCSLSKSVENHDAKLLDVSRSAFGYSTDAQLARFLDLRPSSLSMVRHSGSGLGVMPRLRILCRIDKDVDFDVVANALKSSERLIELLRAPRSSLWLPLAKRPTSHLACIN